MGASRCGREKVGGDVVRSCGLPVSPVSGVCRQGYRGR